jgi:hypothetical protein
MEDTRHYITRSHEVVSVERVDEALLCPDENVSARDTPQHQETEVVRVDSGGAIDHLARIVVVVKGFAREMHVLR